MKVTVVALTSQVESFDVISFLVDCQQWCEHGVKTVEEDFRVDGFRMVAMTVTRNFLVKILSGMRVELS